MNQNRKVSKITLSGNTIHRQITNTFLDTDEHVKITRNYLCNSTNVLARENNYLQLLVLLMRGSTNNESMFCKEMLKRGQDASIIIRKKYMMGSVNIFDANFV